MRVDEKRIVLRHMRLSDLLRLAARHVSDEVMQAELHERARKLGPLEPGLLEACGAGRFP